MMESVFDQALALHLWRPLDIQFARLLADNHQPALQLAIACLSADAGAGHVCLPLSLLQPLRLFDGRYPQLAQQAWALAGEPDTARWQQLLLSSAAVSDGSRPTPLVLDNQRLYLQRMWQSECRVANYFSARRPALDADDLAIRQTLDRYFPDEGDGTDWQKIAAAVAITEPVALISGGPGTGKTTTVAKLLAALVALNHGRRLRMMMAAPTGKAAARLSGSLGQALQGLGVDAAGRKLFPAEAVTLHRLLGAQPNSQRLRYHAGNPLHVDVLIIDEASMVDLPMMSHLIAALPAQARVIFLGDRCQLSSVEAGAVLGDICYFAEQDYSTPRRQRLEQLTGQSLPAEKGNPPHPVSDRLCLLRKSYRFDQDSGIGQLANAVNAGDQAGALALLHRTDRADVEYVPLQADQDYARLLEGALAGYRDYLQRVNAGDAAADILQAFSHYRMLCALREGPFGVSGLNMRIEQRLEQAGLIRRPQDSSTRGYAGRPVMLVRNAPNLGLYNGDIGIMLPNENGELRVFFPLPDGAIKAVPLSRLPAHETAYAMTVHKSQGSEFTHTALVLPNQLAPVLTRELLYTAITRARRQLSVYASDAVVAYAILTPTQRRSGLIDRLLAS